MTDPIDNAIDAANTAEELAKLTFQVEAITQLLEPVLERGFEICARLDLELTQTLPGELGRYVTDEELDRWWDRTGYQAFQTAARTLVNDSEADRRLADAELDLLSTLHVAAPQLYAGLPIDAKVRLVIEKRRGRQLLAGLRLIDDPSPAVLDLIDELERAVVAFEANAEAVAAE